MNKIEEKLAKAVIAAGLDEGRLITVDSITSECFVHPNLAKLALSEFAKDNDGYLDIIVYKSKTNEETGALEVSLEYLDKSENTPEVLNSKHIYGVARKWKTEIGIALHEPFYSDLSTPIRGEPEKPLNTDEFLDIEEILNPNQTQVLEDKCARASLSAVCIDDILEENENKKKKLQGNFTRVKNTSAANSCSVGQLYDTN